MLLALLRERMCSKSLMTEAGGVHEVFGGSGTYCCLPKQFRQMPIELVQSNRKRRTVLLVFLLSCEMVGQRCFTCCPTDATTGDVSVSTSRDSRRQYVIEEVWILIISSYYYCNSKGNIIYKYCMFWINDCNLPHVCLSRCHCLALLIIELRLEIILGKSLSTQHFLVWP